MTPEDVAEEFFKRLISRNLIEVAKVRSDGSPKTCRMPGGIWDVFYPEAADLGLFHIHNNTDYSYAPPKDLQIQRLAEYTGIQNYPSSDPFIRYLRSYVSSNTRTRFAFPKDR